MFCLDYVLLFCSEIVIYEFVIAQVNAISNDDGGWGDLAPHLAHRLALEGKTPK